MSRIVPDLSSATPAGAHAVQVGRHRLNATDLAAHRRFWVELLGGKLSRLGEADVISLPGASLLLCEQHPTGGSGGSTVDHLGFGVPDLRGLVRRLQAEGIQMVTARVVGGCEGSIHYSADQDLHLAFARGPDRIRVELMEDRALDGTAGHHIHIYTEDDAASQTWYAEHFDGQPGTRGRFRKVDIPGIELSFARSAGPSEPTKGRVLDHIGFEVKGLGRFCERLGRKGIHFERPFAPIEGSGAFEAAISDPWGTGISLTEGLA